MIFIQGGSKFIEQTLMVGTGHCEDHLLYRNMWGQVEHSGTTMEPT